MSENCKDKKPNKKVVVYHKIVEKRLDSVAGGALVAILETFLKEDGYFCAPIYNEEFHLEYLLSNDPDRIVEVVDDCMTEVSLHDEFCQIKSFLETGKRVVFAGLPCHCKELKQSLSKEYTDLYVIEIICGGVSDSALVDKYIYEREQERSSKIVRVHFHDKEFPYCNSKRITYEDGRTIYKYKKEAFDILLERNCFIYSKCRDCNLCNTYSNEVDLSLGIYDQTYFIGDNLGYSVVFINTIKGQELYEQSLRRLEIYEEGGNIRDNLIFKKTINNHSISIEDLRTSVLDDLVNGLYGKSNKYYRSLKQVYRLFLRVKDVSKFHPCCLYKFIKYNFFRKNTRTDFWNLGYVFIAPYSEFELAKDAVIELHGPLYVGTAKRVSKSHLETRLWMRERSKLIVHKQCTFAFGGDVQIFRDAVLDVGDLVTASPFTIICGKKIELGAPVYIARNTEVRDTNSHLLSTNGFKLNRPIAIGNHVWIASNCAIMPGTKIGDGSVIAGVSYVNKKISSFSIAEGHPAEAKSTIKYFRM